MTDMSMFAYADASNQDLSAWDTSSVTDMGGMFWEAHAFNRNLSVWGKFGNQDYLVRLLEISPGLYIFDFRALNALWTNEKQFPRHSKVSNACTATRRNPTIRL